MLKFDSLPPQPGHVSLTETAIKSVDSAPDISPGYSLGQLAASAIVENSASYEDSLQIRDELVAQLPEGIRVNFANGFHQEFVSTMRELSAGVLS